MERNPYKSEQQEVPPPFSAMPEYNIQAPVDPMQSPYNQTATDIKQPGRHDLYNAWYDQQGDHFGYMMVPTSNVQVTQISAAAPIVIENKRGSDYMGLSILVCFFCSPIPGILAILFSSMASSEYDANNYEGGRTYSRWALFFIILSVVLGITATAVLIALLKSNSD